MKVLLTGASGMLGQELSKCLSERHELTAYDHAALDILSFEKLIQVVSADRPDVIVNAAAYTRVDQAEDEFEKAYLVNGVGVYNLARVSERYGVRLCHISTDYVFRGDKHTPYLPFDRTDPINAYGRSKLAGEEFIRMRMREYFIIRTSWLYGLGGNNFVKTILRLLDEREEVRVVSDQIGSPTWTGTLARAVSDIIETDAYGIHHVTDRTENGISWYEFALEIGRFAGKGDRIRPIPSSEFPTRAVRPAYSVLDTSFTEVVTGISLPDWRDSLSNFLRSLA